MDTRLGESPLFHIRTGAGQPVLALHGAGVDHRELMQALEALHVLDAYQRDYVDLPGMGRSSADGISSNADVVSIIERFIDENLATPPIIIGHSYGASLAQAIATQRPDRVRALILICTAGSGAEGVPEGQNVVDDGSAADVLDADHLAAFHDYFVVRTAQTAQLYRERVQPGADLVDEAALERIFGQWSLDVDPESFSGPVLLIAGRRDGVVGFANSERLASQYPRAEVVVLDDAGHALIHEAPQELAGIIRRWLPGALGASS